MVITGDSGENDLPSGETSGLSHLLRLVGGTNLASVYQFRNWEIIRNDRVARIEALCSLEDGVRSQAVA
jgi:phosphate starvation-inducible protein PhoH